MSLGGAGLGSSNTGGSGNSLSNIVGEKWSSLSGEQVFWRPQHNTFSFSRMYKLPYYNVVQEFLHENKVFVNNIMFFTKITSRLIGIRIFENVQKMLHKSTWRMYDCCTCNKYVSWKIKKKSNVLFPSE